MIVPNRVSPLGGSFLCQILNANMYIQETKASYETMLNKTNEMVLKKCPILFTPLAMNEKDEWIDKKGNR